MATRAATFAASDSVAPMKFAILVEAAIDIGNGNWYVVAAIVDRTDCAARCAPERYDAASVRISKARNSARTMMRPGMASLIIGHQFWSAEREKPPQHSRPSTK